MRRRSSVLLVFLGGILLASGSAAADSTCRVGSGAFVAGTYDDGVQVCFSAGLVGGTVTVTPDYAAYDGKATNPEPLDGYIAADITGLYGCASGEWNPDPNASNSPIQNMAGSGPCAPQPGI